MVDSNETRQASRFEIERDRQVDRRRRAARRCDNCAFWHFISTDPRKVERHTVSAAGNVHLSSVDVDTPDTHTPPQGLDNDSVPFADGSGVQGASHDGPIADDRERTIDVEQGNTLSKLSRGALLTSPSSALVSSRNPAPVCAEQGTTASVGARACIAEMTGAGSARSALVTATSPRGMLRLRRICRCSNVWGFGPSLAATTKRYTPTPPTPATMARTKRSCPGTSTTDAVHPDGNSRSAYPSEIEMPRRRSSSKVSVSVP